MRIAFVSAQGQLTSAGTFASGPANYLLRVSLSLQACGHEPVIFSIGSTHGTTRMQGVEVISVGAKHPSRAQRFLSGTVHVHAYYSKVLNEHIKAYHRKRPLDIIQYTNYRATALHRPKDIPAVMRISSYRPLWDALHAMAGRKISRKRAKDLERKALYVVDALYGPSRLLAEAVAHDTGRSIEVIEPPFFFETATTDNTLLNEVAGNQPYFLFVGSMTQRKGVHILAEAALPILASYPNLLLLIAGRDKPFGSSTMVNHMRELLGSYGDRMIYLGEVPHARLYPLFSSASAVVLPSLVDNLPNSCLEAMASGSIVIGTDGASFEQVIEHASNGFLAAPNSVRSLARAMREALMLDETARARMKALAQRRIEELSPQRQVPRLVEFYERTITGVRDD